MCATWCAANMPLCFSKRKHMLAFMSFCSMLASKHVFYSIITAVKQSNTFHMFMLTVMILYDFCDCLLKVTKGSLDI